MRLARDFGTIRELYPPGVNDLREMPYPWFDTIRQAMVFLSFEELEKEERPPKAIWLNGDRLTEHFDAVQARREEKWGGSGDTTTIEDPVQNDAAGGLLVG